MSAGEFNHLRHFCFGNFVGEDSADTHTVTMDLEHDLHRLVAPLVEEAFEDVHDEFHRRVIVVEQENFVEAGPLRLRARFGDNAGADAVVLARLASVTLLFAHRRSFKRGDSTAGLASPSLTAREAGLANRTGQKG